MEPLIGKNIFWWIYLHKDFCNTVQLAKKEAVAKNRNKHNQHILVYITQRKNEHRSFVYKCNVSSWTKFLWLLFRCVNFSEVARLFSRLFTFRTATTHVFFWDASNYSCVWAYMYIVFIWGCYTHKSYTHTSIFKLK